MFVHANLCTQLGVCLRTGGYFYALFVFPLTRLKSLTEVPSRWSLCCFSFRANFSPSSCRLIPGQMNESPNSPLTLPLMVLICMPACLHWELRQLFFFFSPPMICRTTGSLSHWSCVDTKGCGDLVRSVYTGGNDPPSRPRPVCAVLSIRLSIPKLHMFLNL